MSLNKFTDSVIKPYLQVGANTINCLNLQKNGSDVHSTNSYYDNCTITSSNGTISNATCYICVNRYVMTMNVRAVLNPATDTSSIFITVNIPLLTIADTTKEANCVGHITGTNTLISKQCILQTNTKLYSQYVSSNNITVGDNWLNATYIFSIL